MFSRVFGPVTRAAATGDGASRCALPVGVIKPAPTAARRLAAVGGSRSSRRRSGSVCVPSRRSWRPTRRPAAEDQPGADRGVRSGVSGARRRCRSSSSRAPTPAQPQSRRKRSASMTVCCQRRRGCSRGGQSQRVGTRPQSTRGQQIGTAAFFFWPCQNARIAESRTFLAFLTFRHGRRYVGTVALVACRKLTSHLLATAPLPQPRIDKVVFARPAPVARRDRRPQPVSFDQRGQRELNLVCLAQARQPRLAAEWRAFTTSASHQESSARRRRRAGRPRVARRRRTPAPPSA